MSSSNDFLVIFLILLGIVLFMTITLPLKNWLEIKRVKKKDERWTRWLNDRPTKEKYCLLHGQSPDKIECDYCGSKRQMPSLEMVITYNPRFGILSNRFEKYSHFKTYICSGCGTELFRERYEE